MAKYPWFQNFIRRQPTTQTTNFKGEDYIPYGQYDNFPLNLAKLVNDSPAASSCISVLADFIEGDGFSTDVGDLIVNPQGDTLSEIHNFLSTSLAIHEGFAVNVKYSASAKIIAMHAVPFENCRLGKPDSKGIISEIYYNPYFGTGQYNKKDTIVYDTFDPNPQTVVAQAKKRGDKFKGQILYWGSTRALSRFYPQPSYYSAKNWMEVDYRIGEYHKNNLANGFLQSAIFKIVGDPNRPITNPDDSVYDNTNQKQEPIKTAGEAFDEMMSDNFSGTERVGNVMAMWAQNKEEFPVVEGFPTSVNAQLLDTLQNLTTKNITIATKVPAILANIHEGVSLGGDGNTIEAAVKLMQQRAAKWQAILEGQYDKILEFWHETVETPIEIVDHNPFPKSQTVDPMVWEFLNPETKKRWIEENTNITWVEPVQASPQPIKALLISGYPSKASMNAKKAIKWNEETKSCGTPQGWETAGRIAAGDPLSVKTVRRLRNFLKRNIVNMNNPFSESCDAVLFYAWGGKEMYDWAEQRIKEIDE